MISIIAKNLRKQIAKRKKNLADVVHVISGIDKDLLDPDKLAKQLKPTKNNGKRGILMFTSTNLTRLHQSSGRSIMACEAEVTVQKKDDGYLKIGL